MASAATAGTVVAELEAEASPEALASVRKRLAPDEEALGVRMGTLFAIAKRHTRLPLSEVQQLLAHPAYEPRLAALCILDFKARRKRIDGHGRGTLARTYLGHGDLHDGTSGLEELVDRHRGETVVVVRGGDDTDPVLLLVDADGVTRQPIEGLS